MIYDWNVATILALVRKQRNALIAGLIAGLLLAITYMHVANPRYTVSLQLTPAPSSQNRGGASALGALAGGLGLGSSSGEANPMKIYVAAMQSRTVAELIAADHAMMVRLYPGAWSEQDHAWKQPASMMRPVMALVKGILGMPSPEWHPPNADSVYDFLKGNIAVSESRDSPIVTVSLQSADRKLASDFLLVLARDSDELMRRRALVRSNNYIEFIGAELQRVTVSEYRTALVQHLYDEEKNRIMASARNVTFAADVFSGPMISPKPTSPSLPAVLIANLMLGLVLGLGLALILERRGQVLRMPWQERQAPAKRQQITV